MTYHEELNKATNEARQLKSTLVEQVKYVMKAMKGKGNPAMVVQMLKGEPCACEECYWAEREAARKSRPVLVLQDEEELE